MLLALLVTAVGFAAAPLISQHLSARLPALAVAATAAIGGLAAVLQPVLSELFAGRARFRSRQQEQEDVAIDWVAGTGRQLPKVRGLADQPLLIGIHPAIPLSAEADVELSEELPTYVPRDIDADLHAALRAMSTKGGFLLLIGSAGSGKTRCLYEAIRSVLPDWRLLLRPDPADLNRLVASGASFRRTVVWLDDVHRFLSDGQLPSRTVRRLLANRAEPVVIAGTIWPEHYEQLTPRRDVLALGLTQPLDAADLNGGFSAHTNSRRGAPTDEASDILHLAHRFTLPRLLSPTEQTRAQQVAVLDPRIGEALRHQGDEGAMSVLAAAPELHHRWENPTNEIGGTVLTAALHARVSGHPELIPATLLRSVVETAYLSGSQRATAKREWFTDAVAWATQTVRGDVAPLKPYGERVGYVDGYQVSDILVERARDASKSQKPIPEAMLQTLIDNASIDACVLIGATMATSGNNKAAEKAWIRAAEAGDIRAMYNLGMLLEDEDLEMARTWYSRAADGGHRDAMTSLGYTYDLEGDTRGARSWYERAAAEGELRAMYNLALLLDKGGEASAACEWYRRAAEAGDVNSMVNLGYLLDKRGDVEPAIDWMRRAAIAGSGMAMGNLGQMLRKRGDLSKALEWLQKGADAGAPGAMFGLAVLLSERGELGRAIEWYEKAFEAGSVRAANNLGVLYKQRGEFDLALRWLHKAAEQMDGKSMSSLGELLAKLGENDVALDWIRRAAEVGDPRGKLHLASAEIQKGRTEVVQGWFLQAVDDADTPNIIVLAFALLSAGEGDAVRRSFRRCADTKNAVMMAQLASTLIAKGDTETIGEWLAEASLTTHPVEVAVLCHLLAHFNVLEPTRWWLDRAIDENDYDYSVVFGTVLRQHDLDYLSSSLRRATDRGNDAAVRALDFLLRTN